MTGQVEAGMVAELREAAASDKVLMFDVPDLLGRAANEIVLLNRIITELERERDACPLCSGSAFEEAALSNPAIVAAIEQALTVPLDELHRRER